MIQKIEGNLIQVVRPFGRVDQIGGHHGVEKHAVERDAATIEYEPIILDVLADLLDARIFQQRLQGL